MVSEELGHILFVESALLKWVLLRRGGVLLGNNNFGGGLGIRHSIEASFVLLKYASLRFGVIGLLPKELMSVSFVELGVWVYFHAVAHVHEVVSNCKSILLVGLSIADSIKLIGIPIVVALSVLILFLPVEALHVLAEVGVVLNFCRQTHRVYYALRLSACLVQFVEIQLLGLLFLHSVEFCHVFHKFFLLEFRKVFQCIARNSWLIEGLHASLLLDSFGEREVFGLGETLLGLRVGIDVIVELGLAWELVLGVQRVNVSLGFGLLLQGSSEGTLDVTGIVRLYKVLSLELLSENASFIFAPCLSPINILGMETSTGHKIGVFLAHWNAHWFASLDFSNVNQLALSVSAHIGRVQRIHHSRRHELGLGDI